MPMTLGYMPIPTLFFLGNYRFDFFLENSMKVCTPYRSNRLGNHFNVSLHENPDSPKIPESANEIEFSGYSNSCFSIKTNLTNSSRSDSNCSVLCKNIRLKLVF